MGTEREGPLGGGSMNAVFREGDTVVRDAGPWTPTVHRHLRYLRLAGLDWVPEPVEIVRDAAGEPVRERLSHLDGEVPAYPMPGWVWDERVLGEGARRLRRLHEASVGFGLDGARWQSPAKVPAEVICHNDFSPHNLVFRGGRIVGVIDFDFCSPGPRLWDLAYFTTRVVPLTAVTPEHAPPMTDARRRVQLILDAYGDGHGMIWEDVLRVAVIRLYDLADLCRQVAAGGDKPELLEDADGYERDGRYLASLRP